MDLSLFPSLHRSPPRICRSIRPCPSLQHASSRSEGGFWRFSPFSLFFLRSLLGRCSRIEGCTVPRHRFFCSSFRCVTLQCLSVIDQHLVLTVFNHTYVSTYAIVHFMSVVNLHFWAASPPVLVACITSQRECSRCPRMLTCVAYLVYTRFSSLGNGI